VSLFYINYPHVLPEDQHTVEFALTYGAGDSIARGTKKFMQELLDDIGLKGDVVKWTLQPCRSKYYSEYIGAEDWRDNWSVVWKIRIQTAQKLDSLPISEPLIETNAFDSTWTISNTLKDDAEVDCLIISDFDTKISLEETQKTILNAVTKDGLKKLREKYARELPTFSQVKIRGKYHQLEVNLGKFSGSFFAQGADYAEGILKLCQKMNGAVNFSDHAY
jgi:hypothetical protein